MTHLATWLAWSSSLVLLASAKPPPHFDWHAVQPTWDLRYTACYSGDFECARVLMPLDWLAHHDAQDPSLDSRGGSPGDNRTVALAVIKVPAAVGPDHPSYGGTVMINPGGPGDSGIMEVLINGRYLQDLMGPNRTYELLSFDPRGVAYSTPTAGCYPLAGTGAREAHFWQERGLNAWDLDAVGGVTDEYLKARLAFSKAYGRQCASHREEGEEDYDVHGFTSTASVAHDMLRLVDETEALRKKQLKEIKMGGVSHQQQQRPLSGGDESDPLPRLQYYGTSYGTVLGNFFLSMFPGRVKRIVFDGVVDSEAWVTDDWTNSLENTQDCFHYFYQTCFNAKGSKCPLKQKGDNSWHDIKHRVDSLVADLRADPVPVTSPGADGAEIVITGDDILDIMFASMYAPLDQFELLARTLAQAARGNYALLYDELVPQPTEEDKSVDEGEKPEDRLRKMYSWQAEAGDSTTCGDTGDHSGLELRDYRNMVEYARRLYPELKRLAQMAVFRCAGWATVPRLRFTGPFTSPKPVTLTEEGEELAENGGEGGPSAPLLLLSNTYDPITPLRSAHTAARGHPGARVLTQRSVGHCTMFSSPSGCTREVVRAYMKDGTVPEEGRECEGDCRPFEECGYERGHLPR